MAKTTEATGTTTRSQRGWRRRRSILTGVVPSGHEQAELLDARAGASGLAGDRALVHDRDPVGEGEDLVQVLADQQHRDAVRGRVAEVRVDGLDRADVEAARRRRGDEQPRLPRELSGQHDLL